MRIKRAACAALVAGAALVGGLSLAGCRAAPRASGVPAGHPAAVVLLSGPNRLVTVDLTTRRMASDVALRSLALDVAVDNASGLAMTAQCGGVGDTADDALGLCDVRRGDRPEYVTLPRANPGVVACAEGLAFVEHGSFEEGGLFMSVVDPARRSVVATGLAPDGPGVSMVGGPRGLSVLAADDDAETEAAADGPGALRLVSFEGTRSVRGEGMPVPAGTTVLAGDAEGRLGVFGGGLTTRSGTLPWFAEVARRGGVSTPVTLRGLRAVARGCLTSGHAVAAGGDEGPRSEAGTLAILDRRARRETGTLKIDGTVMALCPWMDDVLVVTRDPCRLVAVDPSVPRVLFAVELTDRAVIGADVDVLPAGEPHRPSARASP